MENKTNTTPAPSILAPAGSRSSFLAALAAGTDAIYCGLKRFSARMEAQNFTLKELAALTAMAHDRGAKVFVTVNTQIKPDEIHETGSLLEKLDRSIRPDALIIQDLALVDLVRRSRFSGELILSTLANVSYPEALPLVADRLGINRVVMPRELNIDEIRAIAGACPDHVGLEIFVHGALCYGVSGRCYWSSYMGGKSGLRGRCVQPCRRLYRQGGRPERSFSCQDLSLDVLVKVLLDIPQIRHWKIEGRKKGPHYVYYTVKAYKLLRDHGRDPRAKKEALSLLEQALGRRTTHYHFLPQRPQNPVDPSGQTGSGYLVGRIKGERSRSFLVPNVQLLSGDILRIGYEDEKWHQTLKVTRDVPARGRFYVKPPSRGTPPKIGTPVFLIDRREKALEEMLRSLENDFQHIPASSWMPGTFHIKLQTWQARRKSIRELRVYRNSGSASGRIGLWLSAETLTAAHPDRIWWWLPPVVWPSDTAELSARLQQIIRRGGRHFVLNAPWQTTFFDNPGASVLWAGPFCNITNPLAINILASLGFSGAVVSPELGEADYLAMPKFSDLPLGVVLSGNWPVCIARTVSDTIRPAVPFASPMGEEAWVQQPDANFWVYPNWVIDLSSQKDRLKAAGYSLLVHLEEPVPDAVRLKKREGLWNWNLGLI